MKAGTRASKLALAQTNQVIQELNKNTPEKIEKKLIKTTGDKITTSQLYNIDSKGLFTKELDRAVLEEEVDFAVHSLKDVPTQLPETLEIIAVPPRESPNEILISTKPWNKLKPGTTLGTSSLRREAFCNHHQKKFKLKPIRGSIETRLHKTLNGECDATIMAEAGLNRLGLTKYITEQFPTNYIMPPAGQGALAIITRNDTPYKELIKKLNHYTSSQEVLAEKTVLDTLGIGCQWPLGAIAKTENNTITLESILLNKKGEILCKATEKGNIADAYDIGKKVANKMEDYI